MEFLSPGIRNLSILTNFSNNESFSDNCRDKFCNLSFKLESSSSFLLSTCWEPVINKHLLYEPCHVISNNMAF